MWTDRRSGAALLLAGFALFAAGCGGEAEDAPVVDTPVAETPDIAAAPEPPANEPATIAELFPEGEGKDLVLANCTSCHAVACAVIGQRPQDRWDNLAEAHAEHVSSLSDADRGVIFAYLSEHFSDQDPEPYVPAQFLERGCTPF